jgi:hypothetical protein
MLVKFIESYFTIPCYHDRHFLKIAKEFEYYTYITKLFNRINLEAFFIYKSSVKFGIFLLKLGEKQFKDKKTGRIFIFYKVLYDGKIFWVYSPYIKEIY